MLMPALVAAQSPNIRRVLTPVFSDTITTEALEERNGQATLLAPNTPFTGIVLDRWPNGQLKLLRSVENGKATGLWTEWYDTGVIRYLAEWHPEGSGEGAWFYFHENGVVRDRTVYRRDIPVGPSEGWHANGRKAFAGVYDSIGGREGVWRWWGEDGQIDREVTFAAGQAESLGAT